MLIFRENTLNSNNKVQLHILSTSLICGIVLTSCLFLCFQTSCVQIDTAIKTFEDFREEFYESNPPADIKILEDRVSEVENDIKFLLEASRFIDSAERGKENKLDLINNSLKELNDNIDRLKKDFSFCFLENDLLSM